MAIVVQIARDVHERIMTAAHGSAVEVCGLLFGTTDRVDTAVPCRNVAADPRCAFEIDPAALIAAHRRARAGGPRIVGCYHSHPSGAPEPSLHDGRAAAPDGWVWIIAAGDELGVWRAVARGERHGRFDAVQADWT